MKAISPLPFEPDGHVEMALPWYVNGTLSAPERLQVEQHLAECPRCRASQRLEELLRGELQAAAEVPECAPQFGWAGLVGKLDVPAAPELPAADEILPRQRGPRRARPSLNSLLLLAQAAAIAVMAVALLRGNDVPASYRTLSDAASVVGTAPALRVVFADQTTSAEIQRLLTQIGGAISAGPTASNVYTVKLVGGSDEAARWLRTQSGVLFAEPIESAVPE